MAEALLAAQRRQKVLDELCSRGVVRTAELARALGVSEMTIHRDLDALAACGLARKVFGGAVAGRVRDAGAGCAVCGAVLGKCLDFTVALTDSGGRVACCSHCGLMLLQRLGRQAQSAVTFDFVSRQTVNARAAVYVLESQATPCCAPSVLAFRERADAERFRAGFGGRVADFETAMAWLATTMGLAGVPIARLAGAAPAGR